uniref:UBA domain-containing protein n=1 Tax=Strigamia maritima TaxID=126957 RepID=T1IS82_STRMM
MFVSDTNIFNTQAIKVNVVNIDGTVCLLDVLPEFNVEKVKVMALGHFLNPIDSIKLATSYKLLAVSTNKVLINENTLIQENVKENGNIFQTELRKILISLVDASQKILCQDPEVLGLFKELHDSLFTDKKQVKDGNEIDPGVLKQLTDMGFTERKAINALRLNNGPSSKLPVEPIRLYTVAEILEAFRAHKRKTFRPNMRALVNLKEMGFGEEEVLDALRINNNNQDVACEWLLGDRHATVQDLETGLDPNGPIYKAILSNPVVQLGLNNPKTFLAFLHMLENPNTANHWLNDPDTAPLLSQIFRIYHAEKHSIPTRTASTTDT